MTLIDFKLLVLGALATVGLSAVSILAGLVIGAGVCAAGLSGRRGPTAFARVYVSFFRGVPLLVQLLLIYHLLPAIGVNVPSVVAALVGLSLCTAAYQAENFRGGLLNVSRGLIEAGQMVGLGRVQIFLRIRLPIAARLVLPSLVNEAILILKASSLVSVVGVADLTRVAQNIASSNFEPIPTYATAGALYLVVNWTLAAGGWGLDRWLGWGRR